MRTFWPIVPNRFLCWMLAGAPVVAPIDFTAQTSGEKHWSHWMTSEEADLGQARVAFETQRAAFDAPRSVGVKPFERWSWWMQSRGGLNASPQAENWFKAAQQWQDNGSTASTSGNPWFYEGPESVPIHGGAGRINNIIIDPHDQSHWFACAPAGGLWHSTNSGQDWTVFGIDALAPLGVTDLWVDPNDPNHLWVATGDGNGGDTYSIGVLETWNGGGTWSPLELAFDVSQTRRVYQIAPHPFYDDIMWVATDLGLFQTSNGGLTFDLILSGTVREVVWMSDSTAIAGVQNVGIKRTIDGGMTWSDVLLPQSDNSIGRIQLSAESWEMDAGERDTVYAIAGHYFQQNFLAFWASTDGGETWTAEATRTTGPNLLGYTISGADNAGQAFWDLCVTVDPNDAKHVLVGGVNVWETWTGGMSWTCPVHWQGALEAKYAHADQHDIEFTSDGSVLLANDGGVFLWSDNEVQDRSMGLAISQGYAMGWHPHIPERWMVGTQDNGTTLVDGDVESQILDGDGFHAFFDPSNPERLYASSYYGLLYRSDDGGRTMQQIANYFASSGPNELGAWQTPFELHPTVPGRIVAAKKSLHTSDDGGQTWSTIGGMGTSTRSTAMALSASNSDAALVAKNSNLFWKAQEAAEFVAVNGTTGQQIGDVAIDRFDESTWWVAYATYDDTTQVWRTMDGGQLWSNVSLGLPALPINAILQLSDGRWVCGSDLGLHLWDESTGQWQDWGAGLPLTPVVDIQEDLAMNRVVASTYGRGVWASPLDSNGPQLYVTQLNAPETQCLNHLSIRPEFYNGSALPMDGITYIVQAEQADVLLMDTVVVTLDEALVPGARVELPTWDMTTPNSGLWSVTVTPWNGADSMATNARTETVLASGLGHTMTLEWWGDCENKDMLWHVMPADTLNDVVLQSRPLAAGDTVTVSWCLSYGCYDLIWEDKGGDGFSGSDCGFTGGFELLDPFGTIVAGEDGLDFGSELGVFFCVDVPWCFADYNGDGTRTVQDLLAILSEFGCTANCYADNNQDGSVGVADLMNMLSVYGLNCIAEP